MFLKMDSTGLLFTANYPYPNSKCTVNFLCIADSSISSDIVAVCKRWGNTWPLSISNNFVV